jgi:hypothetical protein
VWGRQHTATEADSAGIAEGGARWSVAPHVVGLTIACLLGVVLWLRSVDLDPGGGGGPIVAPDQAATSAAPQTAMSAGRTQTPALLAPYDPTAPDREPLAGLPGAFERFGGQFAIRHPAYLPADITPFTVNWQPDSDPARRAAGLGELYTWFYSAEHGAVLVLAQGRGVGVWPLTARDNRAGRLYLSDGTEVIWVIGHPVRVSGGAGPEWEGTEVTLGVAPVDGDGWFLRSPIISLPEMIRIAESLADVEAIGKR